MRLAYSTVARTLEHCAQRNSRAAALPRQRQKLAFCSTKSNFEWSKFAPRHSPAKPPGNFDRVVTLIRCVLQSSQNFYRGFGISSAFIREGDTTSHGGRVLACTSTNVVFGKTLAL